MRSITVMMSTLLLSILAIEDRPRFYVNRQFWNSSSVVESISTSSKEKKILDNTPLSTATEATKIVPVSDVVEPSLSWVEDEAGVASKETLPWLNTQVHTQVPPLLVTTTPSGVLSRTPTTTGSGTTLRPGIDAAVSTSPSTEFWNALPSPSSTVLTTTHPTRSAMSDSTVTSDTSTPNSALSDGFDDTIPSTISPGSSRMPSITYQGSNFTGSSPRRQTDTSFHPVQKTVAITTLNSGVVTSDWIGTSIYLQPTSSGPSMAMASSAPSGIPSSLPQVVLPVAGFPDAPIGYTLIQVGFSYGLNYEFVVTNSLSSAQIFTYLPQGISYGIGVDGSNVIIHSLMPYDTTKSLGYVTTLALAYIPSNAVANLAIKIHVPLSRLYSNPSSPVSIVMSHINPAISIKVSQDMKTSSPSIASEGSTLPATVSKENQPPVGKTATAGIAAGAVVAAAVCGGVMFFILRRYKSGLSSSKIVHSANANLNKGALMSGGRQSDISDPILAENTLGWN